MSDETQLFESPTALSAVSSREPEGAFASVVDVVVRRADAVVGARPRSADVSRRLAVLAGPSGRTNASVAADEILALGADAVAKDLTRRSTFALVDVVAEIPAESEETGARRTSSSSSSCAPSSAFLRHAGSTILAGGFLLLALIGRILAEFPDEILLTDASHSVTHFRPGEDDLRRRGGRGFRVKDDDFRRAAAPDFRSAGVAGARVKVGVDD